MPRQNKYKGDCETCGEIVNPGSGLLSKRGARWIVRHVSCDKPRIHIIEFSSGAVEYQNANGKCIDAPCCGCCTM